MFNKKYIFSLLLILCLFAISSVSANDLNDNSTLMEDNAVDNDELISISNNDSTLKDNNKVIYFDASASSNGDGSKSNPYKYVNQNTLSGSDITAYFADGVYSLNTPFKISSNVVLIGESRDNTIFNSVLSNKYDFEIMADSKLQISNFTFYRVNIQNHGTIEACDVFFYDGEAFNGDNAPLTYNTKDYGSSYGGVIICDPIGVSSPYVYLSRCEFDNNTAYCGGSISLKNSRLVVNGSSFHNSMAKRKGGAIYALNSDVFISMCDFAMDTAYYGGIIYCEKSVVNLDKWSNYRYSYAHSFGGGIASLYSDINIDSCYFSNLFSLTDAGGAIYNFRGNLNIVDSYVGETSAKFGGAIANLDGNLTVNSSDLYYNEAEDAGGVIYNMYGNMIFENNTFYKSHSFIGSVISSEFSDSLSFINNIFANSTSIESNSPCIAINKYDNITLEGNHFEDSYSFCAEATGYLNGKKFTVRSNVLTYIFSNTGIYYDDYEIAPFDGDFSNLGLKIYDNINSHDSTFFRNYDSLINITVDFSNLCHDDWNDIFFKVYCYNSNGDVLFDDVIYDSDVSGQDRFDFIDNFKIYIVNSYDNFITHTANIPLINSSSSDLNYIPSFYDSRDYGYITPVKDQGEGGNCWAFAGIATLEACIKKITNITYDFSEENVKNIMAEFSRLGLNIDPNEGGYDTMFMAYLTNWYGPTLEVYDNYDDLSAISSVYDSKFHVHNIYFLPPRDNDLDNMYYKQAIMDYGAVSVSFNWLNPSSATLIGWDDDYNNVDSFGVYTIGAWKFKYISTKDGIDNGVGYLSYDIIYDDSFKEKINEYGEFAVSFYPPNYHAVSLVGWDDNYNGFDSLGQYTKGAWIFKNSWGENWGDNGFGYLSYDTSFQSDSNDNCYAYTFIFNKNDYYVSYTQVDYLVFTDYISNYGPIYCDMVLNNNYSPNALEGALSGFSTYFSVPTKYTIRIENADNKLLLYQEGYSDAGYYTIPFNKNILYGDNDSLKIRVGFCNEGLNYFPISQTEYLVKNYLYTDVALISFDGGETFFDLGLINEDFQEPCIQFFSNISERFFASFNIDISKFDSIDIGENVTINITLTDNSSEISTLYANSTIEKIEGTLVNLNINGKDYYPIIHDGKASLDISFDKAGIYSLTAEYKSNRFLSEVAGFNFTVNKKKTKTKLSYSINGNAVTLDAGVDSLFATGNVIFTVNGVDYPVKLVNGKASYTLSNLKADSYDVKAAYKGDSNYKASFSNTVNFNIGSHYLNIIAPDVIKNYGGSEKLVISVTNQESKAVSNIELKVKINDKTYTKKTDSNGKLSIDLDLNYGNYTADIVFDGNDKYKKASTTSKIIVNKLTTNSSLFFNQISHNKVILTAIVNPTDATGNIVFNVNGIDYTVKIVSGQASYQLNNLKINSYTVKATYVGDDIYKASTSNNVKFDVEPHYLNIIAPDVTKTYGENDKLVITLTDQDFNAISNTKLKITLADKTYIKTTDINGKVYVDLDLNYGNYVADIIFEGNGDYDGVNALSNVIINKINTKTDISSTGDSHNTYTLIANVDSLSASGTVVFNVNGVDYSAKVSGGKAIYTLSNLKPGSYKVKATYNGNTNYKSSTSNSISFDISGYVIAVPDVTMDYGVSKNLEITLTRADVPVSNVDIGINVGGDVYTKTTDSKGMVYLPIKLNAGNYDAVVTYQDVFTTAHITVNQLTTQTVLSYVQNTYDNVTLTAVVDPSAAGGNVVFNVNGRDYTAKITNGKATYKLSSLVPGSYTVKATYKGDANHKSSVSNSVSFKIREDKIVVYAPDLTKYYHGSERFVVTVKDDNNPVVGKNVTINLNGRDYVRTTNANGQVSMGIGLDRGVYNVTSEYDGITVYSTITVKTTIEASDITKIFRNGTQYYATFRDSNGNLLKGTDVNFNINGVFYVRKTNENGVAKMNINLNPDRYILTAINPVTGESCGNIINVLPNIVENYDLTKYYKNASRFTFRLLDDQGKPVGAGVSATLNINGVFYTRTTDANGYIKMNINLNPGTYIATIMYNGLNMANTIKVLPILEAKDVVMRYRDGTKFEAKLLDGQGKPFAGQTLTFNINGVMYNRVTDGSGVARLNLNLMAGEYIITSMYENGATIANKVTIRS